MDGWSRLLGDLLKPFQHAEHDEHGDEADGQEDGPALPNGHLVIHQRTDPEEEVANGGGAEPETLTEALQMFRGDFRDEREAQRRDE